MLAGLARGDNSVIPENKILYIPARQIRNDNVDEFRAELDRLLSDASAEADNPPEAKSDASTEKSGTES